MGLPEFRAVRDVIALPDGGFDCTLDLLLGGEWVTASHRATPGGGGICDAVLAEIAAGRFDGEVADWAPPAPDPLAEPLDRKRWLWALVRFGLKPQIDATIAAVSAGDPERAADLEALVYGADRWVFADVLALMTAHADDLAAHAPAIAALTPEALAQMWTEAAAKTFQTGA